MLCLNHTLLSFNNCLLNTYYIVGSVGLVQTNEQDIYLFIKVVSHYINYIKLISVGKNRHLQIPVWTEASDLPNACLVGALDTLFKFDGKALASYHASLILT